MVSFLGNFQLQAVCCSDKKHCCPHGKTCDLSTSTCKGGDVETDWVPKEAAIPLGAMSEQKTFSVLEEASRNGGKSGEQLIQLVSKVTSSRVKDVPCGGGRSCPDYYLCCPGGQSCCPINYVIFPYIHSMHVCVGLQGIGVTSYKFRKAFSANWTIGFVYAVPVLGLPIYKSVFQIIRRCFGHKLQLAHRKLCENPFYESHAQVAV